MSVQVPSSAEKQAQGETGDAKRVDDTSSQQQAGEEGVQPSEVPVPQSPSEQTNASLYVGDLALSVDGDKLKAKFSTVGPVLTTRVCRDAVTRQSLRYGYVNFQTHEDGRLAGLRGGAPLASPITARPLPPLSEEGADDPQLRRARRTADAADVVPAGPGSPTLRQGQPLPQEPSGQVSSKAIYETFSMFGAILSCKVVCDASGKSKGHGFIHFETEKSAKDAIENMNGMKLDNMDIFVGEFIPREKRYNMSAESYTVVYVNNFDESVKEDKLIVLFAEYGPIKSAVVKKSPNRPSGKAYGFVYFESYDDAVKAVEEVNGMEWEGSKLIVKRAMKKAERGSVLRAKREKRNRSNLCVRWIGETFTSDEGLQNEFEPFGTITSAKVMRDEHGCSRQLGFVTFESVESAKRALQAMNGKTVNERPIYVAMAMLRGQRREMLTRQFAQQDRYRRVPQQQRIGVPLYARATVMQQQMLDYPQSRVQFAQPAYYQQPAAYRMPFNVTHPQSNVVPQLMQPVPATIYSAQNAPVGYGFPAKLDYSNKQILDAKSGVRDGPEQ